MSAAMGEDVPVATIRIRCALISRSATRSSMATSIACAVSTRASAMSANTFWAGLDEARSTDLVDGLQAGALRWASLILKSW